MRLIKMAAPLRRMACCEWGVGLMMPSKSCRPTKPSLSLGLSPVISMISSLRLIKVEWHRRQIRHAVNQASRPLLLARKNTTLTALAV